MKRIVTLIKGKITTPRKRDVELGTIEIYKAPDFVSIEAKQGIGYLKYDITISVEDAKDLHKKLGEVLGL